METAVRARLCGCWMCPVCDGLVLAKVGNLLQDETYVANVSDNIILAGRRRRRFLPTERPRKVST